MKVAESDVDVSTSLKDAPTLHIKVCLQVCRSATVHVKKVV